MLKDKKKEFARSTFKNENTFIGESIERKIEKAIYSNSAIESISPIIYTERKDGVKPEYDIRNDKWEQAQEAMQYVAEKKLEKRNKKVSDEPSQ